MQASQMLVDTISSRPINSPTTTLTTKKKLSDLATYNKFQPKVKVVYRIECLLVFNLLSQNPLLKKEQVTDTETKITKRSKGDYWKPHLEVISKGGGEK